ncbi:MAG: metalloregulator ArsR/SmtB family transcription factor [candidate division Zixibacteria bacterium]|nr:metalloregulator ArsR/SmtB family transcription factor [candidate division Zixibacteria bacterium]
MDAKTKALFEARATIIKAVAHPTRLFIVDQLSKKPLCVAELTKMINMDMSTVSRHLVILKNAGIISDEKKGARVYYKLRTPCILNFFTCVENVLKSSATDQLALVKR